MARTLLPLELANLKALLHEFFTGNDTVFDEIWHLFDTNSRNRLVEEDLKSIFTLLFVDYISGPEVKYLVYSADVE